ncbi:MAG: ribonuclease III domain-containing protein [Kofleriaceae bacterium]
MPARTDYDALEQLLGYVFADRGLLVSALRHTSWRNEQAAADGVPVDDNERLEFLGDAVLDLVVGHRLMQRYPQLREGELTVTRAQVVSEAGLSEVASALDLGAWLLLGRGEDKSGGRRKPSILADAFEAIVAAVFSTAASMPPRRWRRGCSRSGSRPSSSRALRLQDAAPGGGPGRAQGAAEATTSSTSKGPTTTSGSWSR